MTPRSNPAIDRYLTALSKELTDLPEPERTEVVGEILNHAAEAMSAGEEPATILERFGDPAQLARAYRVELALEASRGPLRRVGRFFALLGVTAVTGLMSFIVIVVLGAFALGFTGGGVAAIVGGLLSLFLPGDYITSMLPVPQTISELFAIGVGVVLTLAGFVSGVLLFFYVRTVLRSFRRTVRNLRAAR